MALVNGVPPWTGCHAAIRGYPGYRVGKRDVAKASGRWTKESSSAWSQEEAVILQHQNFWKSLHHACLLPRTDQSVRESAAETWWCSGMVRQNRFEYSDVYCGWWIINIPTGWLSFSNEVIMWMSWLINCHGLLDNWFKKEPCHLFLWFY